MLTKGLNVCHVIGSLQIGGAEKLFVNLLNNFNIEGKDALILSNDRQGALLKELDADVNVYYQPVRFLLSPYFIIKMALFFYRKKYDVVHAHMFWASYYSVIAAKLAGVPVVLTSEHGLNPWKKSAETG